MAYRNSWIFLLLAFLPEVYNKANGRDLQVIRGTYHVWWIILPLPKSAVQAMLEATNKHKDVELMSSTWPGYSSDNHPVFMELGEEIDCGPVFPSFLRTNFMEYKFDIPFVTHKNGGKTAFTYKQVLYENSGVESVSSQTFYKLNASEANITKTNNSYTIEKDGATLAAHFSGNDTWYDVTNIPEFKNYMSILTQPWFGGSGMDLCAKHAYDFTSATIRPATTTSLVFDSSLLNSFFPGNHFYIFPLSKAYPLGGVEARINFTMTLPQSCTSNE